MPHHCIVPLCYNNSGMPGLSFYRLPLHNPSLLKEWLVKIRRENTPINEHSRVCSAHFKDGKKAGIFDIPVVFAWTKPPRVSRAVGRTQQPPETSVGPSKKQQSRGITQKSIKEAQLQHSEKSVEDILKDIQGQQPELEHQALESMVAEYEVHDSSPGSEDQCSNIPEKIDVGTNTCHYLDEDVGIQNVPFTLETDVQATVIMDDASVQAVVATEDVGTETSKLVAGVGVMTDDLEVDTTPFCLEAIKEDEKAITFYTGFTSYMHLMICFNFLGPAVATLCYNPKESGKEATFKGRSRSLTPLNEFFLTLCRLRLGLCEQDLAYRFKISQTTVSRIFITWINFMYYKFKEILIWPSRQSVDHYMPNCFRCLYPRTRCIIDATEIYIQMPSNPTAQQLTFSNYKNRNTLKSLIGITPSGAVCFISDLYGGNISDKKLTAECGILKLLESGDAIMADRGFTIEDILPAGVTLNVPPRLNESGQLTENERSTTRRIASIRIHVERAIERIKNYQILHNIPNTIHNSVNQTFFVCAILTNFLPPLVE